MHRQGARSHKSVEDIVQFLTTESSLILQILASLISRNLQTCIPDTETKALVQHQVVPPTVAEVGQDMAGHQHQPDM